MRSHTSLPLLCALQLVDAFITVEEWIAQQRAAGDNGLLLLHHLNVRFVPSSRLPIA